MKKYNSFIILILIILQVFGCVAADGLIRIKGRFPNTDGEPIKNCVLELHTVGSELQPWDIISLDVENISESKTEFLVSRTISPFCNDYFLILKCKNGEYEYRSRTFESCGTTYVKKPYDLGLITIPKD